MLLIMEAFFIAVLVVHCILHSPIVRRVLFYNLRVSSKQSYGNF